MNALTPLMTASRPAAARSERSSSHLPWDVPVELLAYEGDRRDPIELAIERVERLAPSGPSVPSGPGAELHRWLVERPLWVATTSHGGREVLVGIVRDLDELEEAWPSARMHPSGDRAGGTREAGRHLGQVLARLGSPLPVLVAGSALKLDVLRALTRVPLGARLTYAGLAAAAGAPRAVRAAARVMSTNVVPLVLPCHRVVPSSGGTGRYGWGEAVKRWLLALERAAVAPVA